MKRILLLPIIAAFILPMGCTKDFEQINTNPNAASPASFDANFFLAAAENEYKGAIGGYAGPILLQSMWVQLFSSTTTGGSTYYSNGDKYVASANLDSYTANSWGSCFRAAGLAQQVVKDFSADPTKSNVVAAATVVKALAMLYATDIYGDMPYSEALQGLDGITQPAYDKQEDILKGLLAELEAASAQFDAGKPKPTSDVIYSGDVDKWKKLANSLMVRIAMRFTKRDPAYAGAWVEKAYLLGTMDSHLDDCLMYGDVSNGYTNPYAGPLSTPADFYSVRWTNHFVDFLKDHNDPRLSIVAEVPLAGEANNNNSQLAGDTAFALQVGQPNGYDLVGGANDISTEPNYPGPTGAGDDICPIGGYSRPRSALYLDRASPLFILSYAQTELLLAEAAVWGFNVGSASTHYDNALRGGAAGLAWFGASATISDNAINTFATGNPLDESTQGASLQAISEQYWATSGTILMFAEAWNNWRRTGYPVLTPVVAPGNFSGGQIPRRQRYPQSEAAVNATNLAAGIQGLSGGDTWVSRVWWDKP